MRGCHIARDGTIPNLPMPEACLGRLSVMKITGCGTSGHTPIPVPPAKLNISMNQFGILNSRKARSWIALWFILPSSSGDCDAWLRFPEGGNPRPRPGTHRQPTSFSIAIYGTVAAILAWLASISRCAKERTYFALCTSSASFGLATAQFFGDSSYSAARVFARDLVEFRPWCV